MPNYTSGNTRTCGLLGYPVKHTVSPLIHNTLAAMKGIDLVYVPFEVEPSNVADAIKGAKALDLLGLNVTIPHKSEVIPYLDDIDPLAKGIGAVNTLVRTPEGGFMGYNTDLTGLYRAITEEGVELKDKTVVILGAGGVARPAAYLSVNKGAKKVYILNRTFGKAQDVAEEIDPELIIPMELSDYKKLYDLNEKFVVFQCTSVGLFPDVNSAVIEDEEFYEHIEAVVDMIYRPLETKFMKLAKNAGAKAVSGLKMLLYQGIDAFELWNSTPDKELKITQEEADEVYRSLIFEVAGAQNIILEGFMGSGKTTVSEILADMLELELMDTDAAIEEAEGRRISDIFDEEGEEAFRDMETDLLDMIASEHMREMVISLGGGMPLREKNRELLKKSGKVVYLKTSPETVYERIKDDDSRPLLRSKDPLVRIKELQDARSEIYEQAADIIVETDGLTPTEVARKILQEIGIEF
jgi:shikimate dehydrogenase